MAKHIVQSPQWAEFKRVYGTPVVETGNLVFTKHKIPFAGNYYAYCPRIDPSNVNFDELKETLIKENCININFDVPNVIVGDPGSAESENLFKNYCVKSPRDQFAKGNVIMDITKSEDELMEKMYYKHRYNIRYSQKKGVVVVKENSLENFEVFYNLYKQTGDRQKFYYRSHNYLKTLFDVFNKYSMVDIFTSYYENKPLASWMLLNYEGVLYYPYGGSIEEFRNVHGSTLLAWEAILHGKNIGCSTFDMWGTAVNPNDSTDSYYGFTNFKMKFGGRHVVYIDSYDMVADPSSYSIFNLANKVRWKVLNLIR